MPVRLTRQSLPPLAGSFVAVPLLLDAVPQDRTGLTKWKLITKLPFASPLRGSTPRGRVRGRLISNTPAVPCTLRDDIVTNGGGVTAHCGNLKLPMRVCQLTGKRSVVPLAGR